MLDTSWFGFGFYIHLLLRITWNKMTSLKKNGVGNLWHENSVTDLVQEKTEVTFFLTFESICVPGENKTNEAEEVMFCLKS